MLFDQIILFAGTLGLSKTSFWKKIFSNNVLMKMKQSTSPNVHLQEIFFPVTIRFCFAICFRKCNLVSSWAKLHLLIWFGFEISWFLGQPWAFKISAFFIIFIPFFCLFAAKWSTSSCFGKLLDSPLHSTVSLFRTTSFLFFGHQNACLLSFNSFWNKKLVKLNVTCDRNFNFFSETFACQFQLYNIAEPYYFKT